MELFFKKDQDICTNDSEKRMSIIKVWCVPQNSCGQRVMGIWEEKRLLFRYCLLSHLLVDWVASGVGTTPDLTSS
jgi:hypothetical protein